MGYKQQPLELPWLEGEAAHRHLWANNADAISRLYAGTPALKGDFTRTGKRTKRGALDDGYHLMLEEKTEFQIEDLSCLLKRRDCKLGIESQ